MRTWRMKRIVAVFLILCGFSLVLVVYLSNHAPVSQKNQPIELLWWNGITGLTYDETRTCSYQTCRITNNRNRLLQARVMLFYGSDWDPYDTPIPRPRRQQWALLHEESPRNVPFLPHQNILEHFNYTSTFSRYSDFPLTTSYLPRIEDLTTHRYFRTYIAKQAHAVDEDLAPIVFLQSDCNTMSGREEYVRQLMLHIRVDSYGSCLHNRDLPSNLRTDYLNNLFSPELLHFLSLYRFTLSIENGVCADYITEKFWRPFVVGSVPIYFGASTARDWQPNNKSVIYIEDFDTPQQLALYLEELQYNRTAYYEYLRHKLNKVEPVTNNALLQTLIQRDFSIVELNLFQKFECAVCELAHDRTYDTPPTMADIRHYSCPVPPVRIPLKASNTTKKSIEDWTTIMQFGSCQAQLLDEHWRRNERYTKAEIESEVKRRLLVGLC